MGSGVCDLSDVDYRARIYADLDVGSVWGLGPASVDKLGRIGVKTIKEFVALPDDEIRKLLTVVALRTCWELRGILCLPLSEAPSTRKSLAVTRSLGKPIEHWHEMEQAVGSYATRAAEKLRRHKLVASAMQVFLQTNCFSPSDPQYVNQATFGIEPSADSFVVMASAVRAAQRIWREGYRYAKAGVVLLDLSPAREMTPSFFPSRDPKRSAELMRALDTVNLRFGRNTLRPAIVAPRPGWGMRRANVSPSFTTRADQLLEVKA